jgi:hypothetical protein
MSGNFIIPIDDGDKFNKNLIKITNNNIYCYWCDKDELEKIFSNTNNNYSHLSFFFSSISDKVDELTNNGIVMIFLKNPKILYGFIKVEYVIIKNLTKNNYLEEDNFDYNNKLLNNDCVIIDENKFNNLLKQYKMVEVPKMFFIKFKCLYQFKYEISIKKFNDYINSNQFENITEFKYPKCVQNKEMIKSQDEKFIVVLSKYIEYLNILDRTNTTATSTGTSTSSPATITTTTDFELSTSDNFDTDFLNQKFCIPVLWNLCDEMKDILVNLITNKNQKKKFISHYKNCKNCEINDNNDKFVNLENKNITIKFINNEYDTKLFDLIIDKYKNIDNLIIREKNVFDKLNFTKGKINVIYCFKSKSIYKDCLFVIE